MSTHPAHRKASPKPAQKTDPPCASGNLYNIFDEFTLIISGELKSMNLEQFDAERRDR